MNDRNSAKKEIEETVLRRIFSALDLPTDSLMRRESPDFQLELEGRKLGVEITGFHIRKKETRGKSRRSVEVQWRKELLSLIMNKVNSKSELKCKKGTLYFKSLWLPNNKEQEMFIFQIVSLATKMAEDNMELVDDFADYPLLDKYLEKFRLQAVRAYIDWKWNYDSIVSDPSEMEEGLVESISEKTNKKYDRAAFDELWLVVYSGGGFLSQTLLLDRNIFRSFVELEDAAQRSGFNTIIIADLAFRKIIEWPNWRITDYTN